MDNITLKDFSDEELLAELDRRKKPKFTPKQISECNFTMLYAQVIASVTAACNKNYKSDYEHYIWEHAVTAIYGPDFWEEWNKLDKG